MPDPVDVEADIDEAETDMFPDPDGVVELDAESPPTIAPVPVDVSFRTSGVR